MSDQTTRDEKLVQLLNEAYGKERQLEVALQAHLEVTSRADYEKRLRQHLKETKSHATKVAKRIKQLGGTAETVSLPGPDGATKAAQSLQGVVGKAKAAAQAPMHLARGSGEQAKMLHNARAEYRDEAEEIATYMTIDALATSVGDTQTAKLAREIRGEEERMSQFISDLLPQLATDVAHDEIPVSEIHGAADRRSSTGSGRSRRAPAKKAGSSRSKSRSKTSKSRAKRS
jgi:ferritin-like metal-binding protein YciE